MTSSVVRLCRSEEELLAVQRLRYEVYVEEMGRPQPHADHEGRRITDELDATGVVFGLWRDDVLVGTMRLNRVSDGIGKYATWYGLDWLDADEARSHVIGTALMVLPDARRDIGAVELFRASAAWGLANGVRRAWIDCNAHLIRMFEATGYRRGRVFAHPLYGDVQVMWCDLWDTAHLRSVRSPLVPVLERPSAFAPVDPWDTAVPVGVAESSTLAR